MYTYEQRFSMNALTKFYSLILSLAATVVARTPATAAKLGLFEISGTGRTITNVEQQISGTFNQDFTDYDLAVTQLFSTSPGTVIYSDETSSRRGFIDGNIQVNFSTRPNPAAKLRIDSLETIRDNIQVLEIGQSITGSWQQYDTLGDFATAGLGEVTITAVSEPSEIGSMVLAGAMLTGRVWSKKT